MKIITRLIDYTVGTGGICFYRELVPLFKAQQNLDSWIFYLNDQIYGWFGDQTALREKPLSSETEMSINIFTITAEIQARSLANFYCQYADRHMNLKFMRRVSKREPAIRQFV